MSNSFNFKRSKEIYQDALDLIPGGTTGSRHPDFFIRNSYPIYLSSGKGSHIFDVDGNEYIDWLCSYGPNVLGHGHPRITDLAMREIEKGFCLSLCQPVQNRLARKLIELIPCAERVLFVTGGSDATSSAVRIARIHTDREIILRHGYNGYHDWCTPAPHGIPKSVREKVIPFRYNDLEQLETLIQKHQGDIACVIMTPIGHEIRKPIELPSEGYLEGVRKLTEENDIILIFDEIRTGLRLAMAGAQEYYGVVPDMATYSKALSNGFPLAALVMKAKLDESAQKAYVSATYFPNSLPMEAALATIDEIQKNNLIDYMWKIGQSLRDGLLQLQDQFDIPLNVSGLGPILFMNFEEDIENGVLQLGEKTRNFYSGMIRRGIFLHPIHNWYTCAAHTDKGVQQTLQAAEDTLKAVKV